MLDKYQEEFREVLAQSTLVDMETMDNWFTWNNRRGGDHLVASRLDKFLVSENMVKGPGEIRENVLPTASSDHWPVCLSWDGVAARLPNPFRFKQF